MMWNQKSFRPMRPYGSVVSLALAAALFAATVAFVSSCGGGDLVFPGMVPPTPTNQNTATPEPDDDI
jgi:hypothetical protein